MVEKIMPPLSAMVLCAGFGTRLRPLTDHIPKPLLPIGDRPAFHHIIEQLRSFGVGPIAMNTHHRAEAFEDKIPFEINVLHETRILGTAGGVANAQGVLGRGDVLVWNGDMQLDVDLPGLLARHAQAVRTLEAAATLLVARRAAGQGTVGVSRVAAVARLRGERFSEEEAGGDYLGVMVLTERLRERLPPEGCLVGDALLPWLRQQGRVGVAWHEGEWVDIGTPEQYLRANLMWLKKRGISSWVAPSAVMNPRVRLRECVVGEGSEVKGEGELERCVVLAGAVMQAPAQRMIAMPLGVLAV